MICSFGILHKEPTKKELLMRHPVNEALLANQWENRYSEEEVKRMDGKQIGELLARLRQERGMTQRQVAEALHVSPQAVSKWERGVSQS